MTKILLDERRDHPFFPSMSCSVRADDYDLCLSEVKRKIGELQYRRQRLEGELSAINIALLALDEKLALDPTYEQLSMCK